MIQQKVFVRENGSFSVVYPGIGTLGVCLTNIPRPAAGPTEVPFCPSSGKGIPYVWKIVRAKNLWLFLDYTSDLSPGIQTLADNRKQVLSTSFSSHSHVNRRPPSSAPAAASGWSRSEVPSGLQCRLVGWWSHSSSKHLWEAAKVRMISRLWFCVSNQSKSWLPREGLFSKTKGEKKSNKTKLNKIKP